MKRSDYITIGFVFIAVIFVLFFGKHVQSCTHRNAMKSLNRDVEQIDVKGIVNKRFLDPSGHMMETIVVDMKVIVLSQDKSGLFEYVKVGDSIIKERGALRFRVFRDTIERHFEVSFNY